MKTLKRWRALFGVVAFLLLLVLCRSMIQDALLFFPSKHPQGDWKPQSLQFEDAFFASPDGKKLHGWYCPCEFPRAVVLHLHGNAGHLAHRAPLMRFYQRNLNVTSFILDYRGYGRSEGSPTVKGVLEDARAARSWLAKKVGIPESQIVLTGQSLGAAVAVDLAADGARGLVIENTFTSLKDVARHHYPLLSWLASADALNSVAKIKTYKGPFLQSHGDVDSIVPFELGVKLFEAANEPKEFLRIKGGDHNDPPTEEWEKKLDAFIESLPK